jgi:WD40 repeat protein/S1-C subfamily serine protease
MRSFSLFLIVLFTSISTTTAQETLSIEKLKSLKAATAFIMVPHGNAMATGTAWVMKIEGDTAYLVTNNHVVADAPKGDVYPEVVAVFQSGTKDERSAQAEVLASQREPDLAILRVRGVKSLPKPIEMNSNEDIVETQSVFVLGFPFTGLDGAKHPPITVTRGAVSSIRDDGIVQLDTNLNPGNSGGPVVDVKGQLVGIAFARPRGQNESITGIGLAIQPAALDLLLHGRISETAILDKTVTDGKAQVNFEVTLVDPMETIKTVTVIYVEGNTAPEDIQIAPTAVKQEVAVKNQRATGKLTIETKTLGLHSYFCQANWLDRDQKLKTGALLPFHLNFPKNASVKKGDLIVLDRDLESGYIEAIALSPNGKRVASACDTGVVQLLDIANGWKSSALNGHKLPVQSVAFSPDSKWIASSDTSRELDTLLIWDAATEKIVHRIENTKSRMYPIVFSPDGRTLAAAGTDNEVRQFDVLTGKEFEGFKKVEENQAYLYPVMSLAYSPSGRILATGSRDGAVRLWEVGSHKELASIPFDNDGVHCVAWSPDGKTIAAGGQGGLIKWWDSQSKKEKATLMGHEGAVYSLSFTSDSAVMASGSWDGTVRLWHAASNSQITKLVTERDNRYNSVAFSPDDHLLITCQRTAGRVVVFDVQQALEHHSKK